MEQRQICGDFLVVGLDTLLSVLDLLLGSALFFLHVARCLLGSGSLLGLFLF